MRRTVLVAVVLGLVGAACNGGGDGGGDDGAEVVPTTRPTGMEVEVRGGTADGDLSDETSLQGGNRSPGFVWRGVPDGAEELVLIVEDTDADGFVHWLVAGIDPSVTEFELGTVPGGVVEGTNSFGQPGWGGPAPPEGERHQYVFRLAALVATSGLEAGFSRDDFDAVTSEHRIAEASESRFFGG
jgi:Raf kinase inhibitor-like YbhB/YbcL family protein